LAEHEEYGQEFGCQKVESPGGFVFFDRPQWKRTQKTCYSMYNDFETSLPKTPEADGDGKTVHTQAHLPVAFCIVATDFQGQMVEIITKMQTEDGQDMACIFLSELNDLEERLEALRPDHALHFSPEQKQRHEAATHCYLCGERFNPLQQDPKDMGEGLKVADHDHLIERENFRGSCHKSCNSALQRETFLAVIAHNANRYVNDEKKKNNPIK